jgi:hypothetical protein
MITNHSNPSSVDAPAIQAGVPLNSITTGSDWTNVPDVAITRFPSGRTDGYV